MVEGRGIFYGLTTVCSNAFNEDAPLKNDYTELFEAISEKEWSKASILIKTQPQEANTWSAQIDFEGETVWKRLPIHQACINKAPLYIVEALVGVFPESASAIDLNKRFPLHHAALHGSQSKVIEVLLKACPGAVDRIDIYGKTPATCLRSYIPQTSNLVMYNQVAVLLAKPYHGDAIQPFGPESNKVYKNKLTEDYNAQDADDATLEPDSTSIDNAGLNEDQHVPDTDDANLSPGATTMDNNHLDQDQSAKDTNYTDVYSEPTYIQALSRSPNYDRNPTRNQLEENEHKEQDGEKQDEQERQEDIALLKLSSSDILVELKKNLEREHNEKKELNNKLDVIKNRSQILEEIMIKTSRENEDLKHALNHLQREYAKLESDVFSHSSVISAEDRAEIDSLMSMSVLSFDTLRSKPTDRLIDIKAEVKERESMIETALSKAKGVKRSAFT